MKGRCQPQVERRGESRSSLAADGSLRRLREFGHEVIVKDPHVRHCTARIKADPRDARTLADANLLSAYPPRAAPLVADHKKTQNSGPPAAGRQASMPLRPARRFRTWRLSVLRRPSPAYRRDEAVAEPRDVRTQCGRP